MNKWSSKAYGDCPNGEQAYVKVLDVTPVGGAGPDRIKLQFVLSVTKSRSLRHR
ncbi:hypothetical protein [Paenibacillus kribbensis]|uniref:hypothetical protein n=1 Tax=Paenibacillus kribbensis TaxID=172713 RepID=UPI0015BD9BCC|nr:hypothetical protein [Paenibacillus kribbensis]